MGVGTKIREKLKVTSKFYGLFKVYVVFATAFLLSYCISGIISPISNTSATASPSDCDPTTHTTSSGSICSDGNSNLSVSVSNNPLAYYISVSSSHGSSGTPVSLSYSQDGSTGGTLGNVVSSSDNVYLETNSPLNHQLLLSTSGTHSESGIPSSIVANNLTGTNTETTTESGNTSLVTNTYIAPIGNVTTSSLNSATVLGDNTWGFALSSSTTGIETNNFNTTAEYESTDTATLNSNKYATVPTNNNQVLLLQDTEPTSTTTIYYGVKADRNIPAGNYSNTVLYTALAEQPSEIRVCVTDTSGASPVTTCGNGTGTGESVVPGIDLSSPNQPVTIYTSISTTVEEVSEATATVSFYKLETINNTPTRVEQGTCTSPVVSLDTNNFLKVNCTSPTLGLGNYNVELTLTHFGRVLAADNAITYAAADESNLMQEFTSARCNALAESTASADNRITLIDSRDGKTYKVSKLADGNCWMVSNLALDGGITLTPEDSNVLSEKYIRNNLSTNESTDADVASIYSDGADNLDSYGSKYGNLYSYYAATALSYTSATAAGNATYTESVCPKGWQIPNNTGTKSYSSLMSAYGLPSTNTTSATAIQALQNVPMYFPLAGLSSYTANRSWSGVGAYWSRTTSNAFANFPYYLVANSNNGEFRPQDFQSSPRQMMSVRCVFGA